MTKPTDTTFSKSLAFRVDEPTWIALCTMADARGVPPALLVREYVIELLGTGMKVRQYREIPHAELLRQTMVAFVKVTTNLNQLTKVANSEGTTLISTEIEGILAQIALVSETVLKALGVEKSA